MKTHWRWSWRLQHWEPADDFTRWIIAGAPVRIEIDGVGCLYRSGDSPVLYDVEPRAGVLH